MLNFYNVYYTTYHNDTEIGFYKGIILEDENKVEKKVITKLTWENLEDFYYEHGLDCKFNYYHTKKGRVVSFFSNHFFGDYASVSEWKSPLNITIERTIHNVNHLMSIEDVLKWHDSEKAIIFLKERGLGIDK